MRRMLGLVTAAVMGAALLGAPPAAAAEVTWLYVRSFDPLLNENGDGLWESATVTVGTDAEAAHWELASPEGQVVAGAELTAQQLSEASRGQGSFVISSATTGAPLEAGTWTFSVTATAIGKAPATASATIHVTSAPPLTALTPSAATIYPRDTHPGVAHAVAFRHRLDPAITDRVSAVFQVFGPDGFVDGAWTVDGDEPLLRWTGWYQPSGGGTRLAPEGSYRIRMLLSDGDEWTYGPLSQPFSVSWDYRVPVTRTTARLAPATRTATLTQRYARVRAVDGSLRYRAFNTSWRQEPLVRTAHRVSIPRDRAAGFPVFLVVRGRYTLAIDLDLEVVTPAGRIRNVDIFGAKDQRSLTYSIPPGLIRADGTVRFRLLWTTWGPPARTGRTDTVGLEYTTYVWRGPA
ncbi:MAG TPA: hypothetical protein VNS46_01195 [Nocardioides sp.]|nr:hypothetical protein [Nocardioides sp.]